ncbi:MAG: hypothetical protein KDA72_11595 [Planctomycetales bacterium]|nr:hypothetical protein [Planctomycetales bacterium]
MAVEKTDAERRATFETHLKYDRFAFGVGNTDAERRATLKRIWNMVDPPLAHDRGHRFCHRLR